nr:PREDICTED: G-protein coupled receptor Mth2-like isoform X2 [Bemisia tabaci]
MAKMRFTLVVSFLSLLNIEYAGSVDPFPCSERMSIKLDQGSYEEYPNGSLLFRGALYTSDLYWNSTNGVYRLCVCEKLTCWRKCCKEGEAMVGDKCMPSDLHKINLPFSLRNDDQDFTANFSTGFTFIGRPDCQDMFVLNPEEDSDDLYEILPDGRLYMPNYPNKYYNVSVYCLEATVVSDLDLSKVSTILPRLCFPDDSSEEKDHEPCCVMYTYGQLISIPFLAATLVVLFCVQPRWNYHRKSLICYISSLLVSFTTLTFAQWNILIAGRFCTIAALVIQFAFLASFSWLNTMCIDIWWTFSDWTAFRSTIQNKSDRWKLTVSSLYAWGFPSFICSFTALVNYLFRMAKSGRQRVNIVFPDWMDPDIGEKRCFFGTGILLSLNLLLFVVTTIKLYNKLRGKGVLRHHDGKKHEKKERLRLILYMKLFVLMGVSWVAELISKFWDDSIGRFHWMDLFNTLTGVVVFVLFVCNRKTLQHCFPHRQLRKETTKTSTISKMATSNSTSTGDRHCCPRQSDFEVYELKRSDSSNSGSSSTNIF